jgi:hypothetical protein
MDFILSLIGWILIAFLIFILFATSPILPLYYTRKLKGIVPKEHIKGCRLSIWQAWFKNLITMPFDLTAPLVVPIALLFTKWEAERLPKLFRMWDNEINLNGDIGNPTDPKGRIPLDKKNTWAISNCYWAKGHHPRSFYARFVWIGLRNRASYPAWKLGYRNKPEDRRQDWQQGEPDRGAGWQLRMVGGKYRFRYAKAPLRIHYGYKVGGEDWQSPGNVVAIGFSLRKFK